MRTLLITNTLVLVCGAAGYVEAARTLNYELKMVNVDNVENARVYSRGTPRSSLIGFQGAWTAAKQLPFKIGPGTVRVYAYQFPEQRDRKVIVTIGDEAREAVIKDYAEIAGKFGFYEFNTLGQHILRWQALVLKDSTPENVRYNWDKADREIEAFRKAGISIVLQFHIAASGYQPPKVAEYTGQEREEYFELDGTRMQGRKFSARLWLDYVKQFARRYKGKFGKHVIEDEPVYLDVRNSDVRTIHYLLDGVVCGGSQCLYTYYGAHPGNPRGFYIFDEFGRIKPVFHFFATANHLFGGHSGAEAFDEYENLRVGIVKTGENHGVLVLSSTDGKIYDFTLAATGITDVLDGFGNPITGWREADKVNHHVSAHPVYLILEDVKAARKGLDTIRFEEKIAVNITFSTYSSGCLQANLHLKCEEPLEAEMEIENVYNSRQKQIRQATPAGNGLYKLAMPLREPVTHAIDREIEVKLRTNFGDLAAKYPARYAPNAGGEK